VAIFTYFFAPEISLVSKFLLIKIFKTFYRISDKGNRFMLSHRFYLVTVICAARFKVQEILGLPTECLCVCFVFSQKNERLFSYTKITLWIV
jgi:hypothetical protein